VKLHRYQEVAVEHLHANPRSALFLDMGMGKTASVLTALTPDHFPVLVVAPKRVAAETWPAETAKWRPDLSLVHAVGTPSQRKAALAQRKGGPGQRKGVLAKGSDIIVIGRDNMADAVAFGPWQTVILDESSGFKDKTTARWKAAKKLVTSAEYVHELTGTPSPNGLMDLWAQVALLDGGARLGRTLTIYRERFFHVGTTDKGRPKIAPNGVVYGWDLNDGAEERITELISDICMSLDSADHLDLPPVTRNIVSTPMPPKARKAYRDMAEDLVVQLEILGEPVYTAKNAAVMTGKLSQITAGFLYPDKTRPSDPTTNLHTAKLEALEDVIEGTGSPVLVFYRFRHELERIKARFPQAEMIDAPDAISRWNRGEIPVMLAHPASAGHGLNLQHGGHTIVWTTLPWSLEEHQQANARLARQGQTKPVVIHYLMVPDSVDHAILDRLDGKATVEQALRRALNRDV
jgi:SNF2 family DNA or RNA helicase